MACDIHIVVEGLRRDNEKWEWAEWDRLKTLSGYASVIGSLLDERKYSLFYLLAGVRYWQNEGEDPVPLFSGRGLPLGVDSNTYQPFIGEHSFIYIDKHDVDQLESPRGALLNEIDPVFYSVVLRILKGYPYFPTSKKYIEHRFLIGFDS